jgi:hypothetical protein
MIKLVVVFSLCIAMLTAGKNIEIDLTQQKLTAKESGKEIITTKICSGRPGYETPNGKYKVLEKEKMHISNRYPIKDKEANIRGGAKMPYMLRVTNTGVAIHAGEMVAYPDSHGCIRIPYGKAMQLYKWTDIGTKISIVGKAHFSDEINQMRLGILKTKKKTRRKKSSYKIYNIPSKPVKWVDDYLDYYNEL